MRCIAGLPSLALPVRLATGAGFSLKALISPRRRQVRAQAEVDELAHRVALHLVAGLLAGSARTSGSGPSSRTARAPPAFGISFFSIGPVLLDDVRHLLLDGGEVLGRERPRDQEVVEEAVVGGRTDAALRVGEQLGHRRGQQVGGRVAVDLDRGIGRLGLARRTGGVRRFDGGADDI